MNTLSITSTKTMTYEAAAAARSFAIVERLVSVTAALLHAARYIGALSVAPLLPVRTVDLR